MPLFWVSEEVGTKANTKAVKCIWPWKHNSTFYSEKKSEDYMQISLKIHIFEVNVEQVHVCVTTQSKDKLVNRWQF